MLSFSPYQSLAIRDWVSFTHLWESKWVLLVHVLFNPEIANWPADQSAWLCTIWHKYNLANCESGSVFYMHSYIYKWRFYIKICISGFCGKIGNAGNKGLTFSPGSNHPHRGPAALLYVVCSLGHRVTTVVCSFLWTICLVLLGIWFNWIGVCWEQWSNNLPYIQLLDPTL